MIIYSGQESAGVFKWITNDQSRWLFTSHYPKLTVTSNVFIAGKDNIYLTHLNRYPKLNSRNSASMKLMARTLIPAEKFLYTSNRTPSLW